MNDIETSDFCTRPPRPFWPAWLAGLALGAVLLLTFVWTGHGLGATGATTRLTAAIGQTVAPAATQANGYLGPMVEGGRSPLPGHLASGPWFVMSELLGMRNARLYDGSMHQWTLEKRPVEGGVPLQ